MNRHGHIESWASTSLSLTKGIDSMMFKFLSIFIVLFFTTVQLFSQTDKIIVPVSYDQLSLNEFIEKAEQDFSLKFFYKFDTLPDIQINVPDNITPLLTVLSDNLKEFNIVVSADNRGNLFLLKDQPLVTQLASDYFFDPEKGSVDSTEFDKKDSDKDDYLNTNKEYIPETILIGTKKAGLYTSSHRISGYIRSTRDNSPIIGATVYIEELETGTATDHSGFYFMTLKKGKYTLAVNSVEAEGTKYRINVLSDGTLDISLEPKVFQLDEFVVTADRFDNVKGSQMGFEKVTSKTVSEIPTVMGERDIVKVALLLPGVQNVGEGASGFNVRGGQTDQNIFYINNIPIYNTSHLFGFFSVFNADAISGFTLSKSNIPIQYGGRLSSIFDISSREGNREKFSLRGGISPITARLLVEGPLVKKKSSFMVSVRSTYSDWILKLVNDPDIQNSSARFGDAMAGFSILLNPKNRLNLFGYWSHDRANISFSSKQQYGNAGASISWNHFFKNSHDLDVSYVYYNYEFDEENTENRHSAYSQSYKLNHQELKTKLTLRPTPKHTLTLGFNTVLYLTNRGDFLPLNTESLVKPKTFEPEKGLETGVFVGEQWKISSKLEMNGGLRYNLYSYLGPKTVYNYIDGVPTEIDNITDTIYYGNNENIVTYHGLDFRVGARYMINDNLSAKASYNRLHQYIFLLSNTIAISPTDFWKLCDSHIKPMVGDQVSLGIYSNLFGTLIEASIEGYYKDVKNLVEFKDGADLTGNEIPEVDIIQGNLDAYGVEIMIRKPGGRLNGWVNYTYSRAGVIANNPVTGEQNNFGLRYPANWDKPHALNVVANYKITKRFSVSSNLVYSTGRPITYPTAIYYQDGIQITHYSLRNEFRLPDYFRIDLSLNIEGNLKSKKLFHGSWAVSVYNLTGRKNAYSVFFKSENGIVKGYKMSIFGIPIFSVSYNFKLGNYDE